ncbi:MAG: hypothetical protein R3E39_01385 [Anaerolineae bacterium]
MGQLTEPCMTVQPKAAHGTAMHVAAPRRCDFARRGWGVGIQINLLPAARRF